MATHHYYLTLVHFPGIFHTDNYNSSLDLRNPQSTANDATKPIHRDRGETYVSISFMIYLFLLVLKGTSSCEHLFIVYL